MLVYARGWSLPSQFWSYTPPKFSFSAAEKMKIPHWKRDAHAHFDFEKKISDAKFFFLLFWLFLSEILWRRSRLSRTTSDPAQKRGKFQAKIAIFLFFRSAKNLAVLEFREHQGLPPDYFDHARSTALENQNIRWRFFRLFGQFFFEHRQKKVFKRVLHLVLIYTPKEAHGRISWPGGQYSRDKCWQKKTSRGGSLYVVYKMKIQVHVYKLDL